MVTSWPTTPMPRSLAPLPEESLAGFLLRLAHHLDEPPGHVAWRTGMTHNHFNTSLAPRRHLIMMGPGLLATFAHATRMTTDQADQLTFRRFIDRYPPVAEALTRRPGAPPQPRGAFPAWLLTDSTRYCPRCLRGDGSPIQNLYGGTWRLFWHLPIAFACLDHQVMLQDTCPACRLPAQSGHSGISTRLVPNPIKAGHHPVECRNNSDGTPTGSVCGRRLDDASDLHESAFVPELADLQSKLLAMLSPQRDPEESAQSFSDMRVMAAVISATWPRITSIVTLPGALADALEEHSAIQKRAADDIKTLPLRGSRHPSLWSTEPRSAAATAALLSLADQVLRQPTDELRASLAALLETAPSDDDPRWGTAWRILQHQTSPLIRYETEGALRRRFPLQPPGRLDRLPPTPAVLPIQRRGYEPQHVPQELPASWVGVFDRASSTRHSPTRSAAFRRSIAVQLVQAASGMIMAEAARFLGLPDSWIDNPLQLPPIQSELRGPTYGALGAFERLAEYIPTIPLVNYHEHREQFAFWRLNVAEWDRIRDSVTELAPAFRQWDQGDRLRGCASAFVWSKLTGSEWILAPCFRPPFSTVSRPLGRATYESQVVSRLLRRCRSSGQWSPLIPLAAVLNRHVDELLGRDTSGPAHMWLGKESLTR